MLGEPTTNDWWLWFVSVPPLMTTVCPLLQLATMFCCTFGPLGSAAAAVGSASAATADTSAIKPFISPPFPVLPRAPELALATAAESDRHVRDRVARAPAKPKGDGPKPRSCRRFAPAGVAA